MTMMMMQVMQLVMMLVIMLGDDDDDDDDDDGEGVGDDDVGRPGPGASQCGHDGDQGGGWQGALGRQPQRTYSLD